MPRQRMAKRFAFFISHKILILHGRPGCGKSTLVRVTAEAIGFSPLIINAATGEENAASVTEKITTGLTTDSLALTSLSGSKAFLVLLEELDAAPADICSAIVNAIIRVVTNGQPVRRPIVVICADPWVYTLKPLRAVAHMVACTVSVPRAAERLQEILTAQCIANRERPQLEKLVSLTAGDIRESLNALQFAAIEVQQETILGLDPHDASKKSNENPRYNTPNLVSRAIVSITSTACAPSASLYFKVFLLLLFFLGHGGHLSDARSPWAPFCGNRTRL